MNIVRAPRAGEPLLNPRVQAGLRNVMRHVREGCVSDLDPGQLAMHVVTGRSGDGLLTFRSLRGTNGVENYHKKLREVVSSSRTSLRLAHLVLLAFNAAWNIRMADPELRGFWSHWIIEDLQELTEGWWENSLYSGWVSTKEFEDTGEQTGFMASTIPETGNQEDDASSWDLSDDEDEDATERENILKNAVWGVTKSARDLSLMQGGSYGERPTTPVDNPVEAAKFKRDLLRFAFDSAGGATRIDWDAFAASWNSDVEQIEDNLRKQVLVDNTEEEEGEDHGALANVSPRTPGRQYSNSINRKTAQYLSHFWVQSKKSTNARLTMEPHQQRMSQLQQEQRVVCREGRPGTLADCAVTGFTHEGRAVGFPFVGPTSDVARPTPPPPPMDQGGPAAVRLAAAARQAALAGGGGGAGDVAGAGEYIAGTHAPVDNSGAGGGGGSSVGGHGEGGRATTAGDSGVGKRKRSVHVRPVSATSTYDATPIAPRPGSTSQHHQAMHNPGVKPVQPKRAPKT
eukprot:jgi/Undpi1/9138/HiC_scaffold_26.g11596.m1